MGSNCLFHGKLGGPIVYFMETGKICKGTPSTKTEKKNQILAHLSRRLMGELIVYQSLRRPSVRPSTFSSNFSSKTTGQIELKFHMETPWDGGTKVFFKWP